MENLLDPFIRLKDRLLGKEAKEKQKPQLDFNQESLATLREIVLFPPVSLKELPFLCVGEGNSIKGVYYEPYFPRRSGLKRVAEGAYVITTDDLELRHLFDTAYRDGNFDKIQILGHLHPSGPEKRFYLKPSKVLLEPGMGDIGFVKDFMRLNPETTLRYATIAANTPKGPLLKIWYLEDLVKVKRGADIDVLPSQIVELGKN